MKCGERELNVMKTRDRRCLLWRHGGCAGHLGNAKSFAALIIPIYNLEEKVLKVERSKREEVRL